MLDPEAADQAREKVAGDVKEAIEECEPLDQADVWGMRKLAYEIKRRNEADYRFFRFQGEPQLLERLDHNLKITDGVLRFRIFKVEPDSPGEPARRSSSGPWRSRVPAPTAKTGLAVAVATTATSSSFRSFRPFFPYPGRTDRAAT